MTKYFVMRNFRGTCSSVEMLKGYMLICQNAKGVHRKRKVGNPWFRRTGVRSKTINKLKKN